MQLHRGALHTLSSPRLQPLVPHTKLYLPSNATTPSCSTSNRAAGCERSRTRASTSVVCSSSAPSKPVAYGLSGADSKVTQPVSSASISGNESVEDLTKLLQGVASESMRLSPEASTSLERAVPADALHNILPLQLARLLLGVAAAGGSMSQGWLDAALHTTESIITKCQPEQTPLLAELLWAVSELGLSPSPQWLTAAEQAVRQSVEDGSFMAPQFCACICALGELGSQPPRPWLEMVTKEAEYQLAEFTSDFTPTDIARLVVGMSHLKAEIGTTGSSPLMKAVYLKVRTIEDKGLVDWALAKLDSEQKSMVFDPRWNHEELSMLPNREKDKRRILSETWRRSLWGGFRP